MADSIDPRLIDKRTVTRHLRAGTLDEKAYERHLKSLPDLAEQAANVEADLDNGEVEDAEPAEAESV
jgi:hypothetical protein